MTKITNPPLNLQKFTEVSIIHFLNDSKSKAFKKVTCFMAVARTRAFGKWANLRTWISDLIKYPFKHRCDTWVSGCTKWTKKYNGNINKIKNTIETLNNRQKKNDKSQISKWIADTEAVYPELKKYINYVFKIRNGTYWTAQRYAKSGFIEKRFIEECPFCRNIAPETIEHMLLECSRWQALRADILAQYINIYRAQLILKKEIDLNRNIDRFTEFNSIKQPEEIDLELLDQHIYADSSSPSTPNFKKEWDKSDENYTENNLKPRPP
ncbi:hypothetical protein BB561_000108 [Smittium simulii]|uniref:Uncharacterized protein n=1 Tax=Smittium simulii TaxID=133385 RepID=A0A2T9Z0K5_9FUNG|nr:hypothetical protein BB561_000108 [Smittium simulii]